MQALVCGYNTAIRVVRSFDKGEAAIAVKILYSLKYLASLNKLRTPFLKKEKTETNFKLNLLK
jgi:hypothetical protein